MFCQELWVSDLCSHRSELMTKIAEHAKTAHKMDPIPPDIMVKVKAAIKK